MLETMVRNQVIFYVMGILLILGMAARVISAFAIKRMVKAASHIHKSNHKLMKLVKAKFEHACMISDKVENVDAFVDKYIYEYKTCGIRLTGLKAFPKKMLWITAILGIIAIFECYRIDGFGELFMGYVQWTGVLTLLLLLMCYVSEDASQVAAARNYMVEYLENVCAHRYAKAERLSEELQDKEEEMEETGEQQEEVVAEVLPEPTSELPTRSSTDEERSKSEQEMRIRAILEEFLA